MAEVHTKAGIYLQRHGWVLIGTEPHGYATTHFWKNSNGDVFNQTYALIRQREENKTIREAARDMKADMYGENGK